MKPEEIAAYIGAAAWVPQIIKWLYQALLKPNLRMVPNEFGEVGFTSYGPIFNFRMAFFVEHRDLIIDGIDLVVRHEAGEVHEFRWAGLGETFSEITDAAGNKQIVGKDQTPIAIKVGTTSLLEKFVRFQETRFHDADAQSTRALVAHFNFLKQGSPDSFVEKVMESKELFSLVEQRRNWFWWKPGRYDVSLKPSSPQPFNVLGSSFAFELTSLDIQGLQKNLRHIETDIKNIVMSNVPDFKPDPIVWQWTTVTMLRNR